MPEVRRSGAKPIAFLLIAVLGGCTADLGAIREFAEVSAESAAYQQVVNDYVAAPERSKPYASAGLQAELEEQAEKRRAQKEALLALHGTIVEYMDSLGRLAADEAVSLDEQTASLRSALEKTDLFKKQEVAAATSLLGLLGKAALDGWRQAQLKDIIEEANAPFQATADALVIVVRASVVSAQAQQGFIRSSFNATLNDSRDPAGKRSLTEWRDLRLAEVERRKAAAQAYMAIIDRIKRGHQDLYDNRDDLSSEALLATMRRYAKDVRRTFNELRSL